MCPDTVKFCSVQATCQVTEETIVIFFPYVVIMKKSFFSWSMSFALVSLVLGVLTACQPAKEDEVIPTPRPPVTNEVDFWLTKSDQSVKLQKQSSVLGFGTTSNMFPSIEVNEATTYQTVDGFG